MSAPNENAVIASALRDIATKYSLPQCVDFADALDKIVDPVTASAVEANCAMAEAERERAHAERARAKAIIESADSTLAEYRLRSLAQNERQCVAMESIAKSLAQIVVKGTES